MTVHEIILIWDVSYSTLHLFYCTHYLIVYLSDFIYNLAICLSQDWLLKSELDSAMSIKDYECKLQFVNLKNWEKLKK